MQNNLTTTIAQKKLVDTLISDAHLNFKTLSAYTVAKTKDDKVIYFVGTTSIVIKMKAPNGDTVGVKLFTDKKLWEKYVFLFDVKTRDGEQYQIPIVQILENELTIEDTNGNTIHFNAVMHQWVEGVTLSTYLAKNTTPNNTTALAALVKEMASFITTLKQNNVSHGNITDTNIIVTPEGKFTLIDYDSLTLHSDVFFLETPNYCKNFAHPEIEKYLYADDKDDFSLLAIYTALYSYSIDTTLFEKMHRTNALLFSYKDFINPDQSTLINYLHNLKDDYLDILLHELKIALLNKHPRVHNLVALVDTSYYNQKDIHQKTEKKYLETIIDNQYETIEVLKTKYHRQVVNSITKTDATELLTLQQESTIQYINKQRRRYTISKTIAAFLFIGCMLAMVFIFSNLSMKKNGNFINNFDFAKVDKQKIFSTTNDKYTINTKSSVLSTKVVAIKEIKPNQTSITVKIGSRKKENDYAQNDSTKNAPKTVAYTPSVTFKPIKFSK